MTDQKMKSVADSLPIDYFFAMRKIVSCRSWSTRPLRNKIAWSDQRQKSDRPAC